MLCVRGSEEKKELCVYSLCKPSRFCLESEVLRTKQFELKVVESYIGKNWIEKVY